MPRGRLNVPGRARTRATEHSNSATRTYDRLRELIITGRLAPGTRIVESDIAARVGLSRTPVRSALQRLQQQGFIAAPEGGKQARLTVASLTRDDARALFEIVGAVEGLAARHSAELPPAERVEVVATLRKLNTELLRVSRLPRPDQNVVFELDTAFHECYVEASRGMRLLTLHKEIKPQAERYIRLYVSALVTEISASVREHDAIIEAIERGSGDAAREAVEANWQHAGERLSQVIDASGELGTW